MTTLIVVGDTTVTELATVYPISTTGVPVKLVPVIVTVVPIGPDAGEKEVIVGGGK